MLDKVYDRAGYGVFIDYAQSPTPALAKAGVGDWVNELLMEKGI